MSVFMLLKLSARVIARNKMRSFLTMLGIVIGVGAVIGTLAIGQGARASVQAQIASLGTNVIMVFSGSVTRGGVMGGLGSSTTLTSADAEAIRRECPAVDRVAETVRTGGQIVYEERNWSTQVQGVTSDFAAIRNWKIKEGAFVTDADNRGAAKVAVLGKSVIDQLFGSMDPVGETIRIKGLPFKVVGVLDSKGANAMGQDQDDIILIPLATAQKKLMGITNIGSLLISARSADAVSAAVDQISGLLRQRHRIPQGGDDDFIIRNQAEFASAAESTSKILTILLGSVAAVSLAVGGIGIMNIMLVSVTERTREIGIRMAVGAKGRHILVQFLAEAAALSLAGGILGILLGIGIARAVSTFAKWPTLISPFSIALAFAFSAAVGIFFGFYPAQKASRLDPIEALRYE